MELDKIAEELKDIYDFCGCWYDKDNGVELSERITQLNVYLSRSAILLTEAQFILDNKKGIESEKIINNTPNVSPNILKEILTGRCAKERKLQYQSERLNRTITHQLDSIRSQLSFLKSFN